MAPTAAVEEFAPAKINLTLHVTGRRADGYHLLDSLVVFAGVGDRVTARRAAVTTLSVTGPRAAGVPTGPDNLVLRAAALFPEATAALALDKHLPAAGGIGGGSSDAAATLRALARMSGRDLPDAQAVLALGADVPVCVFARPCRMAGIGEILQPVPSLPGLPAVLVNPGVGVSTPAVFKVLASRENPPMAEIPAGLAGAAEAAVWLGTQRNDLEPAAAMVAPEVAQVLRALRGQADCLLARMSGSGGTCFGLFPTDAAAEAAAAALTTARPGWWVAPTRLG
ncbi:4-(cytidine 5'-diphospho)-2-C-methyl-D-erythritol kinase [Tropicimonas sp. IMCC34043]|uniref:4-(cytidine 5'-diphospho)-2-C-methyl-D-erythritol kinase n=1 Tax=Tropicimonas sp. IMCC34043 TaxID=2248760 RepID=UPI000E266E59|nr:4-(cytidine 5'-diphospho)-2-C-methyl-D-erythritol kinase [Tropicimonas sp. IMCC34043]